MSVDDTAKAILAADDVETEVKNGWHLDQLPDTDLQAMAKLWLMRDDIRAAMTEFGKKCPNHEHTLIAFDELKPHP